MASILCMKHIVHMKYIATFVMSKERQQKKRTKKENENDNDRKTTTTRSWSVH